MCVLTNPKVVSISSPSYQLFLTTSAANGSLSVQDGYYYTTIKEPKMQHKTVVCFPASHPPSPFHH